MILIIMTIGIHRSQLKIVIENLGPSSSGMLDSLQNFHGMILYYLPKGKRFAQLNQMQQNAALHTVEQTIKAGLLIT